MDRKTFLAASVKFGAGVALLSAYGRSIAQNPIAMYMGRDRQQVLEAGARKEGKLVFWSNGFEADNTALASGFKAKYPFLDTSYVRADSVAQTTRIFQEYGARQYTVDVVVTDPTTLVGSWIENRLLQPFWSPELTAYPAEQIHEKQYYCGVNADGLGLGFNTRLISRAEAPKTYDDLLDPRWKGKIAIPSSSTSLFWIGTLQALKGDAFLVELAKQNIKVINGTGPAVMNLVASGEVAMAPVLGGQARQLRKNAPTATLDWLPLEPCFVLRQAAAVPARPPHPHAAMLFADFLLSAAYQQSYVGPSDVVRTDSVAKQDLYPPTYKTLLLDKRVKNLQAKMKEWNDIRSRLFLSK